MRLTRSQRISIALAVPSVAVAFAVVAYLTGGPLGGGRRSDSPIALALIWLGMFIGFAVVLVPRGYPVLRVLWAAWAAAVVVLGSGVLAWQVERLEVGLGTGIAAGLAGLVIAIAGGVLVLPTILVISSPGPDAGRPPSPRDGESPVGVRPDARPRPGIGLLIANGAAGLLGFWLGQASRGAGGGCMPPSLVCIDVGGLVLPVLLLASGAIAAVVAFVLGSAYSRRVAVGWGAFAIGSAIGAIVPIP